MASDPIRRRQSEQLRQLREGRPEEDEFDEWWDSQTKELQDEMRQMDPPLIPYREMPMPRNVFPVYDYDSKFATADPRKAEDQIINEGWITTERMKEIVGDVLALVGASPEKSVRAHFDMIRIILETPDAPTQVDLAERMGLTKQAVSIRLKNMIRRATKVAPGLIDRIKLSSFDKIVLKPLKIEENGPVSGPEGGLRNLFQSAHKIRGASTTGKNPVFPFGEDQETSPGAGGRDWEASSAYTKLKDQ